MWGIFDYNVKIQYYDNVAWYTYKCRNLYRTSTVAYLIMSYVCPYSGPGAKSALKAYQEVLRIEER